MPYPGRGGDDSENLLPMINVHGEGLMGQLFPARFASKSENQKWPTLRNLLEVEKINTRQATRPCRARFFQFVSVQRTALNGNFNFELWVSWMARWIKGVAIPEDFISRKR
jgi:hypothetical protein